MDSAAEKPLENNPGVKTERMRIVDRLDGEAQYNPDLQYFTTNHFIVIFRGRENINKKLGGFAEEQPSGLANFLENRVERVASELQIQLPDTFQVVEVSKSGGWLINHGTHYGDREGVYKHKVWEKARFNKVKLTDGVVNGYPELYYNASHEAIGHGILGEVLFNQWNSASWQSSFLVEGLAVYGANLAVDKDSHFDFLAHIVQGAEDFRAFTGKFKIDEMTDNDLVTFSGKKPFLKGDDFLSARDAFSLIDQKTGKGVNRSQVAFGPQHDYYRAPSFIKHIVDNYGVDVVEEWLKMAEFHNFFTSLETLTGKRLSEIEQDWKRSVLSNFDKFNVEDRKSGEGKDIDDKEWQLEIGRRQKIKRLYELYS